MGSSEKAEAMDAAKDEFLDHLEMWPDLGIPQRLLDALEDCHDQLPTELFDVDGQSIGSPHDWTIDLPPGATFADAVRKIKQQAGIR